MKKSRYSQQQHWRQDADVGERLFSAAEQFRACREYFDANEQHSR